MFTVFHEGALDLFGGLVALGDLYAVADSAHVDLGGRGALAGVKAFGIEDGIELAVDFDDIAFAERAGDDFHGEGSSIGRAPPMRGHHTDLAAIRQRFS